MVLATACVGYGLLFSRSVPTTPLVVPGRTPVYFAAGDWTLYGSSDLIEPQDVSITGAAGARVSVLSTLENCMWCFPENTVELDGHTFHYFARFTVETTGQYEVRIDYASARGQSGAIVTPYISAGDEDIEVFLWIIAGIGIGLVGGLAGVILFVVGLIELRRSRVLERGI